MAYCDRCGAYIPDGQTKCLACGYDGEKAAKAASAAAAAQTAPENKEAAASRGSYYSFTNEELKERLAEQRKKQREESRRWAEEEKARRQAAKQAQQSAAYDGHNEGETLDWDEVLDKDDKSKARRSTISGSSSGDSKIFGALSYLGFLCFLPKLFRKDDDFAGFHAQQGLRLFLYNIFANIFGVIPMVGPVMKLFGYYCIYRGMRNAIEGKKEELPYIGKTGSD